MAPRACGSAALRGTARGYAVRLARGKGTGGLRTGRSSSIDDEPSVQEVVRAYLEKDGYQVFVAVNGADGLALAERTKPALIVLDLMLPDISGEEICARSAAAPTCRS